MAKSTGLRARRAYLIDAITTLVGAVNAGARNRPAEVRDGSAQILTTRLECFNVFKVVCSAQTPDASGGYVIEVAHVNLKDNYSPDYSASDAKYWTPVGVISASQQGVTEIPLSGQQIWDSLVDQLVEGTDDMEPRVVAVRATAGDGANGAAAPLGTMTVYLNPVNAATLGG